MKNTYEILNNGAFVVTKDKCGQLVMGFYHDVFNADKIERIFEPIAPIDIFSTSEVMEYIYEAK